jgi:hypothetical protein
MAKFVSPIHLAIPLAILIVGALGCSREGQLTGEVFIVTQGGENVRLGLVEVRAIPEDQVKQFIAKKQAQIKQEQARLMGAMESSKAAQDKARAEFQAADATLAHTMVTLKDTMNAATERVRAAEEFYNKAGRAHLLTLA